MSSLSGHELLKELLPMKTFAKTSIFNFIKRNQIYLQPSDAHRFTLNSLSENRETTCSVRSWHDEVVM